MIETSGTPTLGATAPAAAATTPEAGTETPGQQAAETQTESPAQKRIQQLVKERNDINSVAQWYRENVGTPDDVIAFRQWKAQQVEAAKKQEDAGQITPKQLQAVKDLMKQADPELENLKNSVKADQENKARAMLASAEEEIRDLAKGIGFTGEGAEEQIQFIAKQVAIVIRDDEDLLRLWQAGNISAVKKAFKKVNDMFIQPIRGKGNPARESATAKRKVANLPTLPAGTSTISPTSTQTI